MKIVVVVSFIVSVAIAAVGIGSVETAPLGGQQKMPPSCGTNTGL